MKTKAKLTLAISVLSAAVLAAGVTSTFAWFTIDRTAKVTYGNLTVDTISTIKIDANKLGYDLSNDLNPTGSGTNHVETKAERLGAVSSTDGKAFYAPIALTDAGHLPSKNGDFSAITDKGAWEVPEHTNRNVGFVKYAFTITSDKEESYHSLYWNIVPNADAGEGNEEFAKQWRIAMYESTAAGAAAAVHGVGSVVYGSSTGAGSKSAIDAVDPDTPNNAVSTGTQTVINIEDGTDGFGAGYTKDRLLVTDFTKANSPTLTITIAVWLEGWNNTNNDASGKKLAPVITFSLK